MIGIIYCAYNTQEYVLGSLKPWVELKEKGLCQICAISVPFLKFNEPRKDFTLGLLKEAHAHGKIDHLIEQEEPISEVEARTRGLNLLKASCSLIWMVDSDEFYTSEEIRKITEFVSFNEDIAWFRVCLKNKVFDKKTYLKEPFSPPRIFRKNYGHLTLSNFTDDNDICYETPGGNKIHQLSIASLRIPQKIAWVEHLTWLNDTRSKNKIEYQTSRGWQCSFRWDEKDGLKFNEAYYSSRGMILPELILETS